MNKLYYVSVVTIFMFFISIVSVNAQVPNGDFENWTSGNPDYWSTDNISSISLTPVTQTSDKYTGSSAAKGEVLSAYNQIYPPELTQSFPISQRYATFTAYYKFVPANPNDVMYVGIVLYDSSYTGDGYADTLIAASASNYTKLTMSIFYAGENVTPQIGYILIDIEDTSGTSDPAVGSYFIIDDLQFSGTATGIANNGLNSPKQFTLNQNYPNPFNPTTKISYYIPNKDFVSLKIYNVNGQLVRTLVDGNQAAGSYDITWNGRDAYGREVSSGVYLYRLVSGKYNSIKKMIMLK